MTGTHGVPTVRGTMHPRFEEILTPEALAFIVKLDHEFAGRRADLLQQRRLASHRINAGANLDFNPDTREIREDSTWKVAEPAPGLESRRCELISPAYRTMTVHALNSGADVWIADLEDATAPTWRNMIKGQLNLFDAIRGTITYDDVPGSQSFGVDTQHPTLMLRPRAWHSCEKHITVDSRPMSGTLVDFGLYFFHNAQALIEKGQGPYFYLPKIENAAEAKLWNDVFVYAQNELGIPQGTVRATVLIETITAAFEMEEILFELREHCAGLNAGRWDYIFSYIRTFAQRGDEYVLPDRDRVTMTTPFMRAYTRLLVATCHRRGAHAIGGPAANNPTGQDSDRRDRALNIVRAEKQREAAEGFDGSWVAHPATVETCRQAYESFLGDKIDQRDVIPDVSDITAEMLVSREGLQQTISLGGVRTNVSVALQYLAGWVRGKGAVAIDNLMEDAATMEISRAQLWQWMHHRVSLAEGPTVDENLMNRIVQEEFGKLTRGKSPDEVAALTDARQVLEETAFGEYLPGFFTPYAYVRYLLDPPLQMHGELSKEDIRQSEMV